ncbi:MAG: tetratricopeptide repeat protein [Pyrinomonadaceae bacterium]|nr:tetratricopeptide repeat protein [Pyrinomonadaceae bacterium]
MTSQQASQLEEAKQLGDKVTKLYNEGKYDEALPQAKRALEIIEKNLGPEDPLIVSALINLGEIYIAKRKYGEGQELLERAVKIYEKTVGPNTPRIGELLDRIALTNYARGNSQKTEKLYLRALAIREKAYGGESAEVGKSLSKLAEYYLLEGLYEKAGDVFKRLLPIREKKAGVKNQALIETLERYACLMRKKGQEDEALKLEGRASSLSDVNPNNLPPVEADIVNGRAISLPKPSYPEQARAARVTGLVIVRVLIDERGKVIRACALSGPLPLQLSSEWAAYGAKFTPTLVNGTPVKVTGIITYNYLL